jgi:hypothetical protein
MLDDDYGGVTMAWSPERRHETHGLKPIGRLGSLDRQIGELLR